MGIFGSGQAYEAMLIRMGAHPLPEARECAASLLRELRKVIPAFLTRVDRPDRGVAHGAYLRAGEAAAAELAARPAAARGRPATDGPAVRLVDFDPDGEARVLAHALWPASGRDLGDVRAARRRRSTPGAREAALAAWAGRRGDRRQRPGRALEATVYAFEVVCDYGAYRDLQRHRMLTPPGPAAHARASATRFPPRSPRPAPATPTRPCRSPAPTSTTALVTDMPIEASPTP